MYKATSTSIEIRYVVSEINTLQDFHLYVNLIHLCKASMQMYVCLAVAVMFV
jgi:hypothetical protein